MDILSDAYSNQCISCLLSSHSIKLTITYMMMFIWWCYDDVHDVMLMSFWCLDTWWCQCWTYDDAHNHWFMTNKEGINWCTWWLVSARGHDDACWMMLEMIMPWLCHDVTWPSWGVQEEIIRWDVRMVCHVIII